MRCELRVFPRNSKYVLIVRLRNVSKYCIIKYSTGRCYEDVWKMTDLTDEDEDENKTRGIEGT